MLGSGEAFRYHRVEERALGECQIDMKQFLLLLDQNFLICFRGARTRAGVSDVTSVDKDRFALIIGCQRLSHVLSDIREQQTVCYVSERRALCAEDFAKCERDKSALPAVMARLIPF